MSYTNRMIFLTGLLCLVACSSLPKVVPVPGNGNIDEFASEQNVQDAISFSVIVKYDGLYAEEKRKLLNLKTAIQNGVQAIFDLVIFEPLLSIEGNIPGTVSYDPNWKHYRDVPLQCTKEAFRELSESQPVELNIYKKVCALVTAQNILELRRFAVADLMLKDPILRRSLIKRAGTLSEDPSLNGQGDSIRYLQTTNEKSKFLNGPLVIQRRDLSFYANKHSYVKNVALSSDSGSMKIVSKVPVIAASPEGLDKLLITNLDLYWHLRTKVPILSVDEYTDLSKRALEKSRKFKINENFQECHGGSADDICLDSFPERAISTLNENPKIFDINKRYFQMLKTIDLTPGSNNKDFLEFVKASQFLDDLNYIRTMTWGFILLDNTEIIPKRDGDIVTITFQVNVKKALSQYKTVDLE